MKLQVEGIHCGACPGRIISALLRVDLGARVNFSPDDELRVEGRISLKDAAHAIEALGFRIASVLDSAILDTGVGLGDRARRLPYF